ncbi:MAG: glutathione S-transferase family protein [Steroidobacteraceae bacterium]
MRPTAAYEIVGANGSPYTLKLLAILRYRRLPYVWRVADPVSLPADEAGALRLMPMLRRPGAATFECDSTPLAHSLEAAHPGVRSIVPPDPAVAFLSHLIEDFADEWCTKLMFYYRWHDAEASRWGAHFVVTDVRPDLEGEALEAAISTFYERQRGRRDLVGCGPANGPLLEAHFIEWLRAMEQLGGPARYLFGSRPSLADFGLYGQLSQLVLDPWPLSVVRARAPAVENWVARLADASGVEGEWATSPVGTPAQRALLGMVGRVYLPFLAANARALAAGEAAVALTIDGHPFVQPAFRYQGKCWREIQERWRALDEPARRRLEPLLAETGCLAHLTVG